MKIDGYSFGRLSVDGREYISDVIIYPDRVDDSWWRREGHRLVPEDLPEILADPPELLIIGTGHDGMMRISSEAVEKLHDLGMKVLVARTGEAVQEFNHLRQGHGRIVAALHLTC